MKRIRVRTVNEAKGDALVGTREKKRRKGEYEIDIVCYVPRGCNSESALRSWSFTTADAMHPTQHAGLSPGAGMP